jgi:ubiquinone/menaquinone biosynthesis C-methylase UbiE
MMADTIFQDNYKKYMAERIHHWDQISKNHNSQNLLKRRYHFRLNVIYSNAIPQGSDVLEIGCGQGDLLGALHPSYGMGIDFSEEMINEAKKKHPDLLFLSQDAHQLGDIKHKFDYIILSDLVNDLWDVQRVFEELYKLSKPSTRIIINHYSRIWQIPIKIAEVLHLAVPTMEQNWLTLSDMEDILRLSGFEMINSWREILFPITLPIIADFFDKFLVKVWPFSWFAMTNFIIARPEPNRIISKPAVSIIIPARNEDGNISSIINRIPDMGGLTELVFVEGNSTDNTFETIKSEMLLHPKINARLIKQPGKGKGDAVRAGFDLAKGEILMILDADLTVPPEDLPRFYNALITGKGEFINGVRLVYPMEKEAMRFFNFLGNKFFSIAFSWLLGQPVKDTLCGTKVLWKGDYERIKIGRAYFGDFDPFGDFDLLFGAARLNLRIIDLPIRYHERTYGTTNISRWSHGWLLLKMVAFAAGRIKFI